MKKVAVILSGCGYLDGAEIQESVSTLLALAKKGAKVECFAPDKDQKHVVNHLSGEESPESRNILTEAARIARGKVRDLKSAKPADFDAVILPGGFGVAKNLCTFAFDGPACEVLPEVASFLTEFHKLGKPIGAICISPALIAKVFEGEKVKLTIGKDPGTSQAIESLGSEHIERPVTNICVDEEKRIVTVPAYMYDADVADVYTGIERLVDKVLEMTD